MQKRKNIHEHSRRSSICSFFRSAEQEERKRKERERGGENAFAKRDEQKEEEEKTNLPLLFFALLSVISFREGRKKGK